MTDAQRDEWLARCMAEHKTSLMRMAYLYLGDDELAEDAVQETFIKAYRSLDRFRGESNENTWLMRIAINTCKSMRRTAWMRVFRNGPPLEAVPEPGREDHYRDDTVLRAVMELPDRLRQVVLLYYYQDMKAAEVAQALGISESTVGTRLMRARNKLAISLRGWYFEEE